MRKTFRYPARWRRIAALSYFRRGYLMASEVTWQSNPPEKLLTERFHIGTGFHPGQRDIIEQLVQGRRLLVIQRTGWGKSL